MTTANTKKALRPLQWELHGLVYVARSEVYGATEGGLFWRITPKLKAWRIHLSDGELIAAIPKEYRGPYRDLDLAKMICQNEEEKAWRQERGLRPKELSQRLTFTGTEHQMDELMRLDMGLPVRINSTTVTAWCVIADGFIKNKVGS